MAIRSLVHLNKREEFEGWLYRQGWEREEIKGAYELFRFRKEDKLAIFYFRTGCDHVVAPDGVASNLAISYIKYVRKIKTKKEV